MKKQTLPLVIALVAAGFLTGCLDSKNEPAKTQTPVAVETTDEKKASPEAVTPSTEATPEAKSSESVNAPESTDVQKEVKTETVSNGEPVIKELPYEFFAPLMENVEFLKVAVDPSKNIVDVASNKPVLIDFFWYGCGHCDKVRPFVNELAKNNTHYDIVKYPAVFPSWEQGAKMYFAFKEMGVLDKMHDTTFEAVHSKRLNILNNEPVLKKFITDSGLDYAKFSEISKGFDVNRQVTKAKEVVGAYQITSTPSLAIYYKGYAYITSPMLANGYPQTVQIAKTIMDKLIEDSKK